MNPLFVLDDSLFEAMTREDAFETYKGLKEMGLAQLPAAEIDVRFRVGALPVFSQIPLRVASPFRMTGSIGADYYRVEVGQLPELSNYKFTDADRRDFSAAFEEARFYLIAALAAKNVEKKMIVRDKPKFTHGGTLKHTQVITIRVPRLIYEFGEGEHAGRSVRPHFRRGHIREQPFGPGRRECKRIWIEPLFINGDPEYIDAAGVYKVAS